MKKKICIFVSLICSLLLIITSTTNLISVMAIGDGTTYINSDEVIDHEYKVISNISGSLTIPFYEYQSHFYITMDDVKKITGLPMTVTTGNGIYSAAITDGMWTVYVDLENKTIIEEINDVTVKDSSGNVIENDINAMLYNNKFLVEAVPFLRYLGVAIENIDGSLVCIQNKNSIWSVLPDLMEDLDKYNIHYSSYISNYKIRATLDVFSDFFSDGKFKRNIEDYYKEAIYEM